MYNITFEQDLSFKKQITRYILLGFQQCFSNCILGNSQFLQPFIMFEFISEKEDNVPWRTICSLLPIFSGEVFDTLQFMYVDSEAHQVRPVFSISELSAKPCRPVLPKWLLNTTFELNCTRGLHLPPILYYLSKIYTVLYYIIQNHQAYGGFHSWWKSHNLEVKHFICMQKSPRLIPDGFPVERAKQCCSPKLLRPVWVHSMDRAGLMVCFSMWQFCMFYVSLSWQTSQHGNGIQWKVWQLLCYVDEVHTAADCVLPYLNPP